MPSIDILQFVERTITAICGFFLSLGTSLISLGKKPDSAPKELNTALSDPKLQQVGALTMIFLLFVLASIFFLVTASRPARVGVSKLLSEHNLIQIFKGDIDWVIITIVVFALVATAIIDFSARCITYFICRSKIRTLDEGEIRFALVIPTLIMTVCSTLIALEAVWFINNTSWSTLVLSLIGILTFLAYFFLLCLILAKWLSIPSKHFRLIALICVVYFVGYGFSIFGGSQAALVAARGLNSESLAEGDVLHVLSPICFFGSGHRPHLSAVIVNSGKSVAAIKSSGYVSLNEPHHGWSLGETLGGFNATTGDKDKQPGVIILIKGGDAAAVDFVADADAPDMSKFSNKANICILHWNVYGAASPNLAIAKLLRD